MKMCALILHSGLVLSAVSHMQAGTLSLPAEKAKFKDTPFSDWHGRPYSSIFGLGIAVSNGTQLVERAWVNEEAAADVAPLDKAVKDLGDKGLEALKASAASNGILLLTDYEKLGLNRQIRLMQSDTEGGSAVLLRVRDKFQMLHEDTDAASFTYVDDRKADSQGTQLDAAVMLDFYLGDLYNQNSTVNSRRAWLRVGAEYHVNTLDASKETKTGSAYALVNFVANPDLDAHLLGVPTFYRITSPQILQIGAAYDWNQITDKDDLRWVIGWQPRFVLNADRLGFLSRALALGSRMYYSKGKLFDLYKPRLTATEKATNDDAKVTNERSDIFSFVNPVVKIEGGSEARGNQVEGELNLPNFRDNRSLADFQKEVISYEVEAGFGFCDGRYVLSYSLQGMHLIADFGESHIWHELKAEFNIFGFTNAAGDAPKAATPTFSTYISYTKGEQAPHFEDVDELRVGAQLKF
jgi:hypothetical protein